MKAPKLLIDADFFFYRAASASEQEHEYNPDLTVIVGDFRRGKRIVEQELDKLRSRFDTKDIELFFTDTTNFRKDSRPQLQGQPHKAQALRIPEAQELGPGDICISHHARARG